MTNKYQAQAKQARREARRARMCTRKRAYATEAEAYQKNQVVYLCPYCQQWHRSGKQMAFLRELQRVGRESHG